jgi:hypothetical protein
MTTMDERKRLEQVLAAYGADPDRWPEGDRKLASLISEADRREAQEIDALLASARHPAIASGAQERLAHRLDPTVIAMPARPRLRPLWAGAALAASLAIGIYIGGSGLSDDLIDGVDEPLDLIGLGDVEALAEEDAA